MSYTGTPACSSRAANLTRVLITGDYWNFHLELALNEFLFFLLL
jgi:hypothetical protein